MDFEGFSTTDMIRLKNIQTHSDMVSFLTPVVAFLYAFFSNYAIMTIAAGGTR